MASIIFRGALPFRKPGIMICLRALRYALLTPDSIRSLSISTTMVASLPFLSMLFTFIGLSPPKLVRRAKPFYIYFIADLFYQNMWLLSIVF